MRWVRFLYSLLCIASLAWGAGSLGDEGDAFLRSGQYDDAIAAFQQALRLDATQARTHFQLGNAYAALENYDEAIAAYRQALQQQPGPSLAYVVHQELGTVYSKTGQNAKAITAFEQARQLARDHRIEM
jgi:tetratricopeptide (TPR) repeat protein